MVSVFWGGGGGVVRALGQLEFIIFMFYVKQTDGASLISINGIEEHAFVVNWLENFDGSR